MYMMLCFEPTCVLIYGAQVRLIRACPHNCTGKCDVVYSTNTWGVQHQHMRCTAILRKVYSGVPHQHMWCTTPAYVVYHTSVCGAPQMLLRCTACFDVMLQHATSARRLLRSLTPARCRPFPSSSPPTRRCRQLHIHCRLQFRAHPRRAQRVPLLRSVAAARSRASLPRAHRRSARVRVRARAPNAIPPRALGLRELHCGDQVGLDLDASGV
jgi:hypothetical protein